jgi:HAD superfamily hydrolase (TIGR01484 family)
LLKLIAMDLDGTLTQHKSKLEAMGRKILEELSARYKLLMVCAGGCERVYRQMDGFPIDIIGYYGMERSTSENNEFKIIEKTEIASDKKDIITKIRGLRNELGLNDYYGDEVEFHDSGVITFPVIGTAAPIEVKLSFDPDRTKRRKYYRRVCEVFVDYNVFIGGSSSFDIVPKPYNKLHALESHLRHHNIGNTEVIYFGDDYGLGGNDRDIYNSDIRFITIDDYRDFPKIAKEVIL